MATNDFHKATFGVYVPLDCDIAWRKAYKQAPEDATQVALSMLRAGLTAADYLWWGELMMIGERYSEIIVAACKASEDVGGTWEAK